MATHLYFVFILSFLTPSNNKKVVNGMEFRWQLRPQEILITLSAPTTGWLAVGFNNHSGLKGTNLIMACVENNDVRLEDQYIVRSGLHQTVTSLGGQSQTESISGTETTDSTLIRFRLHLLNDEHHFKITAGTTYYVLLAYSRSDDFNHHSIMRETIPITF